MSTKPYDYTQTAEAYERIRDYIHCTPVFTSSTIDEMVGCKVYFKAENLQKTGAFKARGATNAVLKQKAEKNINHVTCFTTGNHGAGVAYAAQAAGITSTIVLPESVSKNKEGIIKGYGANVVYCDSTWGAGLAKCQEIVKETGAGFVHPCSDFDVMAGQGTIGLEFLEQVPQMDAMLVPVGGGTMSSGISTWTKHVKPECKIFAVEPKGKNLAQTLLTGKQTLKYESQFVNTIADGMRVPIIGENCVPIICSNLEKDVFTVTDKEITSAMKFAYQSLKLVIEPSAATVVAALFTEKFRSYLPHLKHVGVILCGGNVDLDELPWINKK